MQVKDFSVTIGATLVARYQELVEQYLTTDIFEAEDELEEISAFLEKLADMGADFSTIAA